MIETEVGSNPNIVSSECLGWFLRNCDRDYFYQIHAFTNSLSEDFVCSGDITHHEQDLVEHLEVARLN
jgi:hypothetical protein